MLKYLTEENCSDCGAKTRVFEVKAGPKNGVLETFYESREYMCGKDMLWRSTYLSAQVLEPCSETEEAQMMEKQSRRLWTDFTAILSRLELTGEVSTVLSDRVKRRLEFLLDTPYE